MKEVQVIKNNGILVTFGTCNAEKILDHFEDSKTNIAHIWQDVISKYPTKSYGNSLSSGLFETKEGDYTEFTTRRHTLVKVPKELTSTDPKHLKAVQSQLDKFPGVVQRITSHNIEDVLTDGDRYAINNPEFPNINLEFLMDKYETQDKEGNRYSRGFMRSDKDGVVVNSDLAREYSRRVYQKDPVADIDLRTGEILGTQQESDLGTEIIEVMADATGQLTA